MTKELKAVTGLWLIVWILALRAEVSEAPYQPYDLGQVA